MRRQEAPSAGRRTDAEFSELKGAVPRSASWGGDSLSQEAGNGCHSPRPGTWAGQRKAQAPCSDKKAKCLKHLGPKRAAYK